MVDQNQEWIRLGEAWRQCISADLFFEGEKPQQLLGWLKDRQLIARADPLKRAGFPLSDPRIPADCWSPMFHSLGSTRRGWVNWDESLMSCGALGAVWRAENIEVERSAFERLLQEHLSPQPEALPAPGGVEAPKKKGAGGAPRKEDGWDVFWMAVVELALAERLNRSFFHTQAELREDILATIGDCLTERSIKPKVAQIWHRWVDPS
ncbi:hypothetical protein M8312_11840 [Sphingomonas sp. KRR8]|uniref:hypothetical protein n=1 Tax=Sphingomonas sp. KRR8 TaxID=2942996 RepID=UPI0020227A5E|nr:hypothetical protein [Sphingomonas sp. KRR8]URD60467.1 hypothetical protein M8312_11840 [Sphingomonas sp. KRR8]